MHTKFCHYVNNHPLLSFTLITYLLTILVAVLQSLTFGIVSTSSDYQKYSVLFYTYCPAVSAVVLTYASDSLLGIRNLLRKLKPLKNCLWLYVITPIANILILAFIIEISTSDTVFSHLFTIEFIATYTSLLIFQFIVVGIGEEIGWRGYLLDNSLKYFSYVKSIFVVFTVWSVWHIPKFIMFSDFILIAALLIGLLAFSIGFTFFYLKQGGNLFFIILMHSSFNASIEAMYLNVSAQSIGGAWLWFAIFFLISSAILPFKSIKTKN